MTWLVRFVLVACLGLISACSTSNERDKLLDATLDQYAATIRWGDVQAALTFLAPDAKPPSNLELERLKQLQIAGYREQPPVLVSANEIEQVVQIDYVNRHTQESRAVIERFRWRYDDTAKRWWLTSGLPRLRSSQ